jgi:hypothetical protein
MFARIRVGVEWRYSPNHCPAEGIVISLNVNTPASFLPGALAYALPYEGRHIEIFCDRITRCREPVMVSVVLAHVLAHEIAHILEGVARHSEEGIMKAHWDAADLFEMRRKPLEFAPEDVALIHLGLAVNSRRGVTAANTSLARLP